ncbi:hypothetical protein D3C76_1434120 [compost metagenome]
MALLCALPAIPPALLSAPDKVNTAYSGSMPLRAESVILAPVISPAKPPTMVFAPLAVTTGLSEITFTNGDASLKPAMPPILAPLAVVSACTARFAALLAVLSPVMDAFFTTPATPPAEAPAPCRVSVSSVSPA